MKDRGLELFGSRLRTLILIYLAMLEETYAGEMAVLIGVSRVTVYRALKDLEAEGFVAGTLAGRERWVRLNPRNGVFKSLSYLLVQLGENRPEIMAQLSKIRRRPRRRGKPIGAESSS